jgi:hypothetical protein
MIVEFAEEIFQMITNVLLYAVIFRREIAIATEMYSTNAVYVEEQGQTKTTIVKEIVHILMAKIAQVYAEVALFLLIVHNAHM